MFPSRFLYYSHYLNMATNEYQSLVISRSSLRIKVVDKNGRVSDKAKEGVPIVCSGRDPFKVAPVPEEDAIQVTPLSKEMSLPGL